MADPAVMSQSDFEASIRRMAAEAQQAQADRTPEAIDARRREAHDLGLRLVPAFCAVPIRELRERIPSLQVRGVVESWAPKQGGLLLTGPSKCGKTTGAAFAVRRTCYLAAKAGGESWERAHRMVWQHARDLANAEREWPLGRGPCPDVEAAKGASVLVLDDLSPATMTSEVLMPVLNARYERQLPTVVTTGFSLGALRTAYGDATMRRLSEAGGPGRLRAVEA